MGATANLLGALATAISDRMTQGMTEALESGASDAAALLSIGTRPGTSILELSRVVGKSHSATVRIVDRLEDAGLVRRGASGGDGRQVEVALTPAGRKRFERLRQARLGEVGRSLQALAPGERRTLHRLLDELLVAIASDADGARRICRFCDHGICPGTACPVGRRFVPAGGE